MSRWRHDPTTGNPQRNFTPPILRKEVETCGLCHARRAEFFEDWMPGQWLSDTHVVSELAHGLYYADGQMQDEVYNYGSFKQSKMFAGGRQLQRLPRPAQRQTESIRRRRLSAMPRGGQVRDRGA